MTNEELKALRDRWHPSIQTLHYLGCELDAFHEACAVNRLLDALEGKLGNLQTLIDLLECLDMNHGGPQACIHGRCAKCQKEQEICSRLRTRLNSKENTNEDNNDRPIPLRHIRHRSEPVFSDYRERD